MTGKFNPREIFKRKFSGSKSPTSESDDKMNKPRSPSLSGPASGPASPSIAGPGSLSGPVASSPLSYTSSSSPFVPATSPSSSNLATSPLSDNVRRVPSLKQVPESGPVHTSSNPLGMLKSQRQPMGASQLSISGSAATASATSSRGTRIRDLMNRRAAAASPGAQGSISGPPGGGHGFGMMGQSSQPFNHPSASRNAATGPASSSSTTTTTTVSNATTPTPSATSANAPPAMTLQMPGSAPPAMKLQMPGSAPPAMKLQMPGSTPPAMNLRMPGRPSAPGQTHSAPAIPKAGPKAGTKAKGLAARRGHMLMSMSLGPSDMSGGPSLPAGNAARPVAGSATAALMNKANAKKAAAFGGSHLDEFREFINPEEGWLNFDGSATLTKDGVHFANGSTYSMSLDEIESLGELGKGNYGTVYKVRHAKNKQVRIGPGLLGAKPMLKHAATDPTPVSQAGGGLGSKDEDGLSGTIMAMKEIGMELDKAKFKTIAKELMILHQCSSPYIIDFYGAFMQDGFVYMCIEYMDGGSVDKLYKDGVPEDVLQHITLATVLGLNELKEKHNIIHRDVKPTNILVNTRGQVKICDFGVSGDLVASKAKTNIGCQSYMPPERINSNPTMLADMEVDGSYGVQSDIWSLGLSIIECALGKYPYDVDASILVQLNTIVKGEAPKLPETGYSPAAHDFVASCLAKNPIQRPSYTMLLRHAWLASVNKPATISEEDEDVEAVTAGVAGVSVGNGNGSGNDQGPGLGTSLMHMQQPNDKLVADWVKAQLRKNGSLS